MATTIDAVHHRALAADRNRVDLAWEHAQEQAMHAFRNGNATAAMTNWAKALEIAERHFERGDPRLAASLSNQAFALLRQDQIHQANLCFQRAVDAWEDSWRWIPLMTPSAGQDEVEPKPYDQGTQAAFYDLIRQGKAVTKTLWQENRLPETVGDDWLAVKPKGMNDIRRLFSAVFLLPTARSR
ncbi:MAG: tetratricopeptide repeat protein [Alphaproteobacteria bacterium]|nr:tetratricopeptide repeat protein [Alphaproteobacteria bacterium]